MAEMKAHNGGINWAHHAQRAFIEAMRHRTEEEAICSEMETQLGLTKKE